MLLKNCMEDLVFAIIKETSKNISFCTCEKCVLDIAALALNELPPMYVATEKGLLYSKTESLKQQFEIDILTAVTKAIERVNSRPRH